MIAPSALTDFSPLFAEHAAKGETPRSVVTQFVKDDVATAWRLTQRGLAMGHEAEGNESAAPPSFFTLNVHLRDVAKAVLRGEGRLPPLAPPRDTARGGATGESQDEG